MKWIVQRAAALVLCFALLTTPARAAWQTILPQQARDLAVSNSKDISKKTNEIILKQIKYVEAVDAIKAKIKNLRSFRWSPLLNFKFPQQLDLVAEYELNVKPLTLQAEIDTLVHERNDLRFAAVAEVNKRYAQVYLLQEKITFYQARLTAAEAELTRNRARLATGEALQADVDKMEQSAEKLAAELVNLKRGFQSEKNELSDLVKLDVTSSYLFRNPFQSLSLPRKDLDAVIQYALDNDQSVYTARMSASTALMNLSSYESLMRGQYGSKMNIIQTFINMAKGGQDIDYSAFMLKYREMLAALDRPWSFSIRILFFRFSMEWFKGEIDGTRYIEDELYAVYAACMEYANAKKDQEAAEKALRKQVAAQYELLTTAWNAYQSTLGLANNDKEQLDRALLLNRLGKADFDEVREAREGYEEMQLDALDALTFYNTLLFDFDRLTCGAVTRYMQGLSLSGQAGTGGDSFARLDPIHDPYYYIYTTVDDLTFHIGVSIPDDFRPAVTDFEVWSGAIQIGVRTPVEKEVRHLTLDYGGNSSLTLRLYGGDVYVDECQIDATVPRERMELVGGKPFPASGERTVGSYEVSTTSREGISTSTLSLKMNAVLGAASYTITYGDGNVYTGNPIPVDQPFTYLSLLSMSLEEVAISLLDADGALICTGRFDPKTQTIIAPVPQ